MELQELQDIFKISFMHCHSEYSNIRFLDVCHKLTALIDRAVELNAPCMALTDHECLSGAVKAINYVKEQKSKGIIPEDFTLAIGNEIYLVDGLELDEEGRKRSTSDFYHFILIAKDKEGFEQLKELTTMAWSNCYFTGKMARVPTTKENLKQVVSKNPGHLLASTACIGSELGKTLINIYNGTTDLPFADEEYDKQYKEKLINQLDEYLNFCLELFGEDFRLEMQPGISEAQIYVNEMIVQLSEQYNIPYIITTDVHYLSKDKKLLHESYLKSREDEQREVGEFYESTYMMDCEEIHERMDSYLSSEIVNKAIKNTNEWASSIVEYDVYHDQVVPKATIPDFKPTYSFANCYSFCPYIEKFANSDNISDQYFLYLVEQGWWDKEYKDTLSKEEIKEMMLRINDEMRAIWETSEKIHDKVSAYYLTALEVVNLMWDDSENGGNSFVGVSRGSVAAFYTAYLINLQQINPMKYNIPYWRHLHESRPEMPDVDIDSEQSKRDRIIKATKKKYGEDHVLNICSFKTEGSKSAILTSARGMGIDNDVAQYLAGLIPVVRGSVTSLYVMINGDEEEDLKPNIEFINECNKYEGLLETAQSLEGLVCGRTIHASGVIIFDQPYTKFNCMMKAPNGLETTQWNMDDSTYCGGLKLDYLTIKNLDAMHICMDMLVENGHIEWKGSLRDTYNAYFHPDVLDYDSVDMWEMAEKGEIVNLFQFQTLVGSQAIKKIKPKSLIELGVANSVMRLMGSKDSDESPLDTYVRYKNDISQWYDCMHKYNLTDEEIIIVERYLKHVSGMATMQEEVMQLVMDEHISNFDMARSNKLRKSIAKKRKKLQAEAKEMFYKLGRENGTSDNLLDYVWNECVTPQLGLNNNEGSSKTWETQAKAVS